MTGFSASYLEIEPRELVRHLLRGAGQCERECVNPQELLDFLKLEYLSFNFARAAGGSQEGRYYAGMK